MLLRRIAGEPVSDDVQLCAALRRARSAPYHLAREEELERLKQKLIAVDSTVVITGAASAIGVHGMGGVGKKVLDDAVTHDKNVSIPVTLEDGRPSSGPR